MPHRFSPQYGLWNGLEAEGFDHVAILLFNFLGQLYVDMQNVSNHNNFRLKNFDLK